MNPGSVNACPFYFKHGLLLGSNFVPIFNFKLMNFIQLKKFEFKTFTIMYLFIYGNKYLRFLCTTLVWYPFQMSLPNNVFAVKFHLIMIYDYKTLISNQKKTTIYLQSQIMIYPILCKWKPIFECEMSFLGCPFLSAHFIDFVATFDWKLFIFVLFWIKFHLKFLFVRQIIIFIILLLTKVLTDISVIAYFIVIYWNGWKCIIIV